MSRLVAAKFAQINCLENPTDYQTHQFSTINEPVTEWKVHQCIYPPWNYPETNSEFTHSILGWKDVPFLLGPAISSDPKTLLREDAFPPKK